jgi:hypothetical protein
MKVKHDFVTNSSTSCYIVYIPESYKVTTSELKKIYKRGAVELYDEEENQVEEKNVTDVMWTEWEEKLNILIEDLKKGEGFDFESLYNDYNGGVVSFAHEIIGQFTLSSTEVGGGNTTIVVPLSKNDINKIHELDKEYESKIGLCNK